MTPPIPVIRRRQLLHIVLAGAGTIAFPALWLGPRAAPPAPLRPTPAQTEGPFYPVVLPADSDADLLVNGTRRAVAATAVTLAGRVVDLDGRPLKSAVVEIWQCDAQGRYHHPGDRGGRADPDFQGFGRSSVDGDGRYRFRTLRPVSYPGRTPHIHVKVRLGARALLTTQLYVEGDPGNERDGLWRGLRDAADRAALTRPFVAGADGLSAEFPIVIAA
ncbi:MAG TPA: protocatechuate 3,4-dioxygenase [Methylibium sp.]|nr:protocatechuate 3,4-dioxygenase [Methylibium sp.]